MYDTQGFCGNYRNEDCNIKAIPSTPLSFRPAGEIFKGAGNIRTGQGFLALLGMTMGGILKNLRFQKTSESLTRQDAWSFRSSNS
jgi:hypothetical protein